MRISNRIKDRAHPHQNRTSSSEPSELSLSGGLWLYREWRNAILTIQPDLIDVGVRQTIGRRDGNPHLRQQPESTSSLQVLSGRLSRVHPTPEYRWRCSSGEGGFRWLRRGCCFEAKAARHQHAGVRGATHNYELLPFQIRCVCADRELNRRA